MTIPVGGIQARSLSQDERMILMYIKDQGGDPSVMGFPVSRADQWTDVKQQRYQLYSSIADATRVVSAKPNSAMLPCLKVVTSQTAVCATYTHR